jgi:hypothetical protein
LTPLVGVEAVESFVGPLRQGVVHLAAIPLIYLAAVPWMVLAIALACRAVRPALVATVIGMWLLASLLFTFGALGPPLGLISPLGGARYYLFGAMCFCVLLAWGSTARSPLARYTAIAMLVLIISVALNQRLRSFWVPVFTQGPSWKAELEKCVPQSACIVTIWPQGQNRQIDLGVRP